MTDPSGVTHWEGPGLDAWQAWTPAEAAQRLQTVGVSWCVVGGWAIDLFLGHQSRPHDDLEIAVLRPDFGAVRRALAACELFMVGDGEVRRLPTDAQPPLDKHQNWVLDVDAQAWRMDVMLEPGDADTWVFRRDPSVRPPRSFMIDRKEDGIPCLGAHGALLYKAKAARPKDEADFSACLPHLAPEAQAWLAVALDQVHPGHPWRARLG